MVCQGPCPSLLRPSYLVRVWRGCWGVRSRAPFTRRKPPYPHQRTTPPFYGIDPFGLGVGPPVALGGGSQEGLRFAQRDGPGGPTLPQALSHPITKYKTCTTPQFTWYWSITRWSEF